MDTSKIECSDVNSLIQVDKFEKDNIINRNYTLQYGLGNNLLNYVGLNKNYKIKAFFEHGPTFSKNLEGGFRVHESLPSIVSSNFRKNVILSQPNNHGAYSIGPYIAYADSLLSENQIKIEKKRLGKNLLFFPYHSIAESTALYDIDDLCKKIMEESNDFDNIRICLYWRDIKNGFGELYKKYGFEIVSAGYINDPLFLNRLRSLIEISDVTMSNKLGTHVGFSIYLNKPHYIIKTGDIKSKSSSKSRLTQIRHNLNEKMSQGIDQSEIHYIEELLSQKNADKNELIPILDKYFGFSEVKSKKELMNIFCECEKSYSSIRFYFGLIKLIKNYACSFIKNFV